LKTAEYNCVLVTCSKKVSGILLEKIKIHFQYAGLTVLQNV